jgi:Domain of unknown function (DUF4338)
VVEPQLVQGRWIGPEDLAQIRSLLREQPRWSRWRLSRHLAEQWQWRSSSGQLKDMAARTLLLKLQQRGLIKLPARRRKPARRVPRQDFDLFDWIRPPRLESSLAEVLPLQIEAVESDQDDYRLFQRYLVQHHYLGYGGPVGENIGYLVRDRQGRELACVLFGAAAWKAAPRDRWIGWSAPQRSQGLHFVANNSRFLILPWVDIAQLASCVLGRIARRLPQDWLRKYGHPLHLLESFVQVDRFAGTCYRAANWIEVGRTQGRTRQDRSNKIQAPIKAIYLYPLHPRARQRLCDENA